MKYRAPNYQIVFSVQLAILGVLAALLFAGTAWSDRRATNAERDAGFAVIRDTALRVESLYDDPTVVSDEQLAAVLKKIRPMFPLRHLKPNHVEHALRTWGIDARFRDPRALSGRKMLAFLTNHGEYAKSWNNQVDPLLVPQPDGVSIRWGHDAGASVHHDHLVASLSEAGVTRETRVFPPVGPAVTFQDLLRRSARDFRLDEREVEWSAMVFALWLPSETTSWTTTDGRRVNFDLIARRLMRGDARFGVCNGTHRVYSLMLLYRIHDQTPLLSSGVHHSMRRYLLRMRDLIVASQFRDGHWSSNWSAGARSVSHPVNEPDYKAVIATGHHLEWLAISPPEFHPPRSVVRKAAQWLVKNVRETPQPVIMQRYTFYSHVGNALALWRKTRPATFWNARNAKRPE